MSNLEKTATFWWSDVKTNIRTKNSNSRPIPWSNYTNWRKVKTSKSWVVLWFLIFYIINQNGLAFWSFCLAPSWWNWTREKDGSIDNNVNLCLTLQCCRQCKSGFKYICQNEWALDYVGFNARKFCKKFELNIWSKQHVLYRSGLVINADK